MKILPVSDPSFQNYGQVLEGYDLKELLETLDTFRNRRSCRHWRLKRICGTMRTAVCPSRSAGATATTRR